MINVLTNSFLTVSISQDHENMMVLKFLGMTPDITLRPH